MNKNICSNQIDKMTCINEDTIFDINHDIKESSISVEGNCTMIHTINSTQSSSLQLE